MKRVFETAKCDAVMEFHILGAEIRKAQEPNERLWRDNKCQQNRKTASHMLHNDKGSA